MLRVGGHAIGVTPARPRAVLLRGLACVTVMAERLEVGASVGAAVLQPGDVIDLDRFGNVSVPQALCAERVVTKLTRTDYPPPTPDCARRGGGHSIESGGWCWCGQTKGPVSFLTGPNVFAGRNCGSDLH